MTKRAGIIKMKFTFTSVFIERFKGHCVSLSLRNLKNLKFTWITRGSCRSVVACTCNPVTLETEFRNGVGSTPVGGNSPSIGGWVL